MRVRVLLLTLMFCAGAGYIGGVAVHAGPMSAWAGAVAFAALAGYVATAPDSVPVAARWSLVAGALTLAVVVGATASWLSDRRTEYGYFAYEPLAARLRPQFASYLGIQRGAWIGMVLASACLIAAVLALPRRPRPRLLAITLAIGAALLGLQVFVLWYLIEPFHSGLAQRLADLAGGAWIPLVGLVLVLATLIVGGQRAGRAAPAVTGALLLAVPMLLASLAATERAGDVWYFDGLTPGNTAIPLLSENLPTTGLWAAILDLAMLAAVALVAAGCLARPRPDSGAPS